MKSETKLQKSKVSKSDEKLDIGSETNSRNHITEKAAGMSLTLGTTIHKSCTKDSRTVKRIYWSKNNAKRSHEEVSISSEN